MNDELLSYLLAQRAPARKRSCLGTVANAIGWILALLMFIAVMAAVLPDLLVTYKLIAPETMERVLNLAQPTVTVRTIKAPTPAVPPTAPAPVIQSWPPNGPIEEAAPVEAPAPPVEEWHPPLAAPSGDPCADWRPPLVLPEGCR